MSCLQHAFYWCNIPREWFALNSVPYRWARSFESHSGVGWAHAEPENEVVRSHEMFGRYRQLVEELSNGSIVGSDWFEELQAIVLQLDLESCDLTVSSSKFLYEELCGQFEQEAYLTDNEQRRKVLLAATKLLELQRSVS